MFSVADLFLPGYRALACFNPQWPNLNLSVAQFGS